MISDHRCDTCQRALASGKNPPPCDLCLAQRRKLQSDLDLKDGKPTLRYRPFEKIMKKH